MSLIEAVSLLAGANPGVTLLLLALASLVEYVFPPFPGDTGTVAGAVLVVTSGLSLPGMLVATLIGSLAGAAIDFHVGVLLARTADGKVPSTRFASRLARSALVRQALDGAERSSRAFARWGEVAIALNRFLPGIRAFLFVAAGMGNMRFARVMFFAAISALLWNALLVSAGVALGANLDRIESVFRTFGLVAWIVLGVAGALLLVRWAIRRRRAGR